jgi:acetyl-CoA C-acetyltransferase
LIQLKSTYIVEGYRLPVGKANGIYKNIIPEVLAGFLMAKLIEKHPFLKSETDEVILGCALGTGGNMARYATIDAGFDIKTPAFTVDAQCASGLKAIILADQQIKAGAHCIIAGGMESNSLTPKRQYQPNDQRSWGADTFYTEASFAPPQYGYDESLIKAAEYVAQKFNISKDTMMQWTVESHRKASYAINNGYFSQNIIPFSGNKKDQTIKVELTLERLQNAQTSQLIDQTNAAHLHDGACVHLVASNKFCDKHGLQPSFKLFASSTVAGPPNYAPMGVIWAVEDLLQKTGLKPDEIDLFEVNESFAVNALAFAQHFQVKPSKMNIFGGNLAFGHPFGASGAINLLHLIEAMKVTKAKRGIVAIAAAGGLGMAVLIEKSPEA